jgi:hypothetical protein
MALSTYAELKSSVADWLNRSDLTTAIPDFISLAEAQMERKLRTRQMISRASATISTEYSALPDDFLEVKSLKLQTNPVTPLQFETIDSLDNLQQQYRSASKPRFFSIVGNQIRTVPVPDDSYTTELTYYAKLSKLSSTNTTNWLLTAASDAYLYGTLMQAAPYLKDDARIAVWSSMYISALEDLQVSDDRGASSGGALIARAKTFG